MSVTELLVDCRVTCRVGDIDRVGPATVKATDGFRSRTCGAGGGFSVTGDEELGPSKTGILNKGVGTSGVEIVCETVDRCLPEGS